MLHAFFRTLLLLALAFNPLGWLLLFALRRR